LKEEIENTNLWSESFMFKKNLSQKLPNFDKINTKKKDGC